MRLGDRLMTINNLEYERKKTAVIGLGFVGLPLSIMLAEKGFDVTGIDLDPDKINKLQNKESYIGDVDNEKLKEAVESGCFHATSDFDELKRVDAIIICVPTPLTKQDTPDLRFIESAGAEITKRLKKGQLVILESSTFPGTTKEVLLPILEESGLKAGVDFFLANSPERIDPGNKNFTVGEIPKIIGGVTENCKIQAVALYEKIYQKVVPVTSTEAAELTKLLENTFRLVNISFINELAILSDQLHVDIWEVIDAAATKPYGYTAFYPGPGIGGHCIPVDPLYLQWKLKELGLSSDFITISHQVNKQMADYIVNRTEQLIGPKKSITSAKILVYGVTYKRDVADTRDSSALKILEGFIQKGADVSYHDPYIPSLKIEDQVLTSTDITEGFLQNMDCILILTDHTSIPLEQILTHSMLVFDTRNVTKGHPSHAKVIRLGEGYTL